HSHGRRPGSGRGRRSAWRELSDRAVPPSSLLTPGCYRRSDALTPPAPTTGPSRSRPGVPHDRATHRQEEQLMTTLSAHPSNHPPPPVAPAAVAAGLAGMALGAAVTVAVPRLTTSAVDSQTATVTRPTVTVRSGTGGLSGSTVQEQLPPDALRWVRSLASS